MKAFIKDQKDLDKTLFEMPDDTIVEITVKDIKHISDLTMKGVIERFNKTNMKNTNIGSINNRYSEDKAKKEHEDMMNSFWNVVIAVLVAVLVALVVSFITIPR